MEHTVEKFIEGKLEGLTPEDLYGNIIAGAILALIGIFLMIKKSPNKNLKTIGLLCIGIGVASIISGFLHIQEFS
ncbi:hypothetical protein ACFQZ1_09100 [Bacillus sp. CGMCC 1.60114]|uniref:hypothetical protein n=1 Tax=unclassified Bacillus (in: firmicutes) TaxID=185979 RepID=UPI003638EB09